MKSNFCEFGTCKKRQVVRVNMRNAKSSEIRSTDVCCGHLRDVLAACSRNGLLSQVVVLPR